jgi:hypothetical protein
VIDQSLKSDAGFTELSRAEMEQVQGGDSFSVNFTAIKFEYKPQKPDGGLD